MATLTIIRGLPGSGKTTFANERFKGVAHFENDMYFIRNGVYAFDRSKIMDAVKWCQDAVENAMKLGMDIVVSNTFTKRDFVDAYVKLAEKYHYRFSIYSMCGHFKNEHNVPDAVYDKMMWGFEFYPMEIKVIPQGIEKDGRHGYSFSAN